MKKIRQNTIWEQDPKKQLEAPEKIQETLLENEKFVTIQAEVEVPEVSEILLKKVEERQIANEDTRKPCRACCFQKNPCIIRRIIWDMWKAVQQKKNLKRGSNSLRT